MSDPVKFDVNGRTLRGHIAAKSGRKFIVISEDGTEYKAPPERLRADPNGTPRQLLTATEKERLKFSIGDSVVFLHQDQMVVGRILRMNPKTALVLCGDKGEFRVSYGLLHQMPEELLSALCRSPGSGKEAQSAPANSPPKADHAVTAQTDAAAAAAEQKLLAVAARARRLLAKHGLSGWDFAFDNGRKRAGACRFREKRITVSREYALAAGTDHIRDTILHEIAHALAGPDHRHDAVWRKTARSIGCSARRCHDLVFSPPRWIVSCENNCWVAPAERRRRNVQCRECGGAIRYVSYSEERFRQARAAVRS